MNFKKMTALVLAAAVTAGTLSGCGINKNATVATLGDEKVSLGLVNFLLHYSEAGIDDMYLSYFGEGFWEEDLYGNGNTFYDDTKNEMMDKVHEYYTVSDADHMAEFSVELTDDETAAITAAAEQFMSDNTKEAINEMGATQAIVEEALRLITIQSKMSEAIKATADTEVSDEDCRERAYTVVKANTESYYDSSTGTTGEYTEDEKTSITAACNYIYSLASSGTQTIEDSATALGYTASTATYNSADTDLDESVISELDSLKVGEVGMVTTDSAIYIVRIDSDYDEEASETKRQDIITERQTEAYDTQLETWQTDDGWTVDEKVLATIKFDNYLTETVDTEDTEAVTEAVTEAATEAATEAVTEAATESN